ncbi:MAG: hypothetical protein J6Y32_01110 [Bacteroidales bacterium]|nr:hypothetical protein [Bacteroidales bacterium]
MRPYLTTINRRVFLLRLIPLLLAATGIFSACTKELATDATIATGRTTLRVSLPEGLRTSLSERIEAVPNDYYRLYWSDGDAITVNGIASDALSGVAAQSQQAEFTIDQSLDPPFQILYPAAIFSDALHVRLPATLSGNADNISDGQFPLTGYSVDGSMNITLQPLCTLMKISVKRAASDPDTHDIAWVSFKGRANEKLNGVFSINYEENTLEAETTEIAAEQEVKSFCTQALPAEGSIDYYLTIPARTYSNGFSVTVMDVEGHYMVKDFTSSFTPDAGQVIIRQGGAIEFIPTATTLNIEISNAQQLIDFATNYNAKAYEGIDFTVTLTDNIVFDATSSAAFNTTGGIGVKSGAADDPDDYYFNGVFDGGGKTISGLYASVPLFRATGSNGTIRNLAVDNSCYFSFLPPNDYESYFGSVVGYHKGTMDNVSVAAFVDLASGSDEVEQYTNFGGLAGRLTEGSISNCSYSGALSVSEYFYGTTYLRVGGLAGRISNTAGRIHNSNFEGTMDFGGVVNNSNAEVPRIQAGGIVGINAGTVEGCTVAQNDPGIDVTVEDDVSVNIDTLTVTLKFACKPDTYQIAVGGIVGYNLASGSVTGCTNHASALCKFDRKNNEQTLHFGGIAGINEGSVSACDNTGALEGRSDLYYQKIGGIAGTNKGNVSSCRNLTDAAINIGGNETGAFGAYDLELGGIFGALASTGSVSNVSNSAPVSIYRIANNAATIVKVGGVCGLCEAEIDGSTDGGAITNSGKIYEYNNNSKNRTEGFFHGGIVGLAKASVSHVTNNGMVHFNQARNDKFPIAVDLGGIIGKLEAVATADLLNCENQGEVSYQIKQAGSYGNNIGGILGSTSSNVSIGYCTNSGNIHTSGNTTSTDHAFYLGGIVGFLSGHSSISHCDNDGSTMLDQTNNTDDDVSKILADGGIVGVVKGTADERISISDCNWIYPTVKVVGSRRGTCGGVAAYAEYTDIARCDVNVRYNKYNHVTGGVVGWAVQSSVSSCRFLGSIITATQGYVSGGVVAKLTEGSVINGCCNYCTDITTPQAPTVRGEIAATSEVGTVIKNCHYTGTIALCSDGNFSTPEGEENDTNLPAL